jgi:hypothetical protein
MTLASPASRCHVSQVSLAKNDQVAAIVDENRIEQCCAAHIVHSCQKY